MADAVESAGREEIGWAQLEPDVILPAQFVPRPGSTPEKRLLLAVLEEAVGTYQRHLMADDRHSRAVFSEVAAWFASDDTRWLFSYVSICDAIGLDATVMRTGLARWAGIHRTRPARGDAARLSLSVPPGERGEASGRRPGDRRAESRLKLRSPRCRGAEEERHSPDAASASP